MHDRTDNPSRCPLVSVVIPLYNRETTILKAVRSALTQDYPNLEVIVIDDGSTDRSVASLRESISDPRLRVFEQANQGACVARNHGIERTKGRYVALLDSDDTFLPGHISESVNVLEASNGACVVYGRIVVDRGAGKKFLKPPRSIRADEDMSEYLLCDQGFVQTSTVVLASELAMRIGFHPKLRFGQDTDFAIRLASSGAKFVMLEKPQAVWADQSTPDRVSNALDPHARLMWLDEMREIITPKARRGDKGWYVAKCFFKRGKHAKATLLYLKAIGSGCYKPQLAIRIGLQIFLPPVIYRKLADMTLRSES